MNTDQIVVVATTKHPLYEKLKSTFKNFYDLETSDPFDGRIQLFAEVNAIFDFTLMPTDKKLALIEKLSLHFSHPIYSDLTCHWGDAVFETFEKVQGGFSAAFPMKEHNCEFAQKESSPIDQREFFKLMGIEAYQVEAPGIAFTVPRIVSQIINEAYYAEEEGVASAEDINRAMQFGVNYPGGPFEWAEKIGERWVYQILDELHRVTRDNRYRPAPSLRLKAKAL